jgi:hypothetical protein
MTLEVSDSFDEVLRKFADRNRVSKAEAVRRALAVLALVEQETIKGRSLGIVEEDNDTHELHAVGLIRGM